MKLELTKQTTLLILAAGMGSRYGGLKQLDGVGPSGETIMDYSIYDAKRAGFTKVVFVIRKVFEQEFISKVFSKYKGFIELDYVFQELDVLPSSCPPLINRVKPWGTAHAVWVAKDIIKENFAVINADDFYGENAYRAMHSFLQLREKDAQNKYALLGYNIGNTLSKHGSVSRGICKLNKDSYLTSIVEHTNIYLKNIQIFTEQANTKPIELDKNTPVSMNFMGFTPTVFPYIEHYFKSFYTKNRNNLKAEFYLPSLLTNMIHHEEATVKILTSDAQWFGVTFKEDREAVVESIRHLINKGIYPQNLWK